MSIRPEAPAPETQTSREAPLRDPRLVALPSDRLLDELLARLCGVMSADVSQFLLVEDGVLRVLATHGVEWEKVSAVRVPVGRGFAGTIAATAAPAVLPDTSSLETFGASWAEEGVRALVGVPLVVEGQVIGVCVVGSRSDRVFGDNDISLLSAAAERAAWAVQNGLLLAAEQRARHTADSVSERLRRLEAMSNELVSALSVDEVVHVVVERGLSLIGAIAGAFWEPDPDITVLRLRGAVGYPPEVINRWQDLPIDVDAPAADAARTGQHVVLRSIAERDARYPQLRGRATVGAAFVSAPLIVDGRLIGVLGLGFDSADVLDEEGLAFLDASVAQCAAAVHRAVVVQAQQHSLAAAQDATRRVASLQRITAALADARDGAAIVRLILDEVTAVLGAARAMLAVYDEERDVLRAVGSIGVLDADAAEFSEFAMDAAIPVTDALLRREPVVLRTVAERTQRYPELRGMNPDEHALVCLPLSVGEQRLGSLALSFTGHLALSTDDVTFLMALADQSAHALERGRLMDADSTNRQRLELLAEAGRIFAAPLDLHLTSLQFSRLVVGRIGDAVSVHLREADGSYVLAAAEHLDADQARAARALSQNLPPHVIAAYDAVLDAGQPLLTKQIDAAAVLDLIEDGPLRTTLAAMPPVSNLLVPLIAGGHSLGILSVTTVAGGSRPLTESRADQIHELSGRLALALDGARLLRQQTEIAHTLQRSLLPASLPHVPGAAVAWRYLAGAEGLDVGGDFYDVIPLPSGRIGLVVGDVMGRGVRAAAVMGQLRAAVRAYSLEGHPPAAVLTRLDRLVGTLEEGLLVTALYAEWDASRSSIVAACAGHLPPLVRRPGEEPIYIDIDPGLPLGVGGHTYEEAEVELPPGSLWLAFTDGLVEGPDLPVEDGMRELAAAVVDATDPVDACDAALARLRPPGGPRAYDDDTALLALVTRDLALTGEQVSSWRGHSLSTELPADTSSPARARGFVVDILSSWGLVALIDPATLLTSELVTNAVRHAGTGMRVALSRTDDRTIRVAVTDRAPEADVRPRVSPDDAEGGRGLFLVEQLASGWGSVADDDGKTVWFELRA